MGVKALKSFYNQLYDDFIGGGKRLQRTFFEFVRSFVRCRSFVPSFSFVSSFVFIRLLF